MKYASHLDVAAEVGRVADHNGFGKGGAGDSLLSPGGLEPPCRQGSPAEASVQARFSNVHQQIAAIQG